MKNKIKSFYNKNFKDYDQHMQRTGHYKAQKKIVNSIRPYIKEPILDLACGTGYLISLLANNDKRIFGNDFSKNMPTKLLKQSPNIKITTNNAETLRSYKIKFNTLISCNLFYYIQNYNKAVKKWTKLLTKNGKIILIEEYPFISTQMNNSKKLSKELKEIIKPKTIKEINHIMLTNKFKMIKKYKCKIDNKHDLYALIFVKFGDD